jgi:hypothetical protein
MAGIGIVSNDERISNLEVVSGCPKVIARQEGCQPWFAIRWFDQEGQNGVLASDVMAKQLKKVSAGNGQPDPNPSGRV